jgi:hypothetical protein
MLRNVVAIIIGVVIGAAGPQYAFLGAYSLIPWALVAVALGFRANKREAFKSGAVYGFSLSFAFLVASWSAGSRFSSSSPSSARRAVWR